MGLSFYPRLFIFLLMPLFVACATRYDVASNYQDLLNKDSRGSGQTTVVFLIDGLRVDLLQTELSAGHLPNLLGHFLPSGGSIPLARTVFPSLTYPAIASLLTERPVEKHSIIGNHLVGSDDGINFESPKWHPELNRRIVGLTIFDRLKARGLRTVSLDYAFHSGSSVHTDPKDVKAGLAILDQDYTYMDEKTLEGLGHLLRDSPSVQWPDFIFVHLVGVDFVSHDEGPESAKVRAILQGLDQQLASVFSLMSKAEARGHRVITLLTADHGFDITQNKVLDLEAAINRNSHGSVKVLDEGRYLGLTFPAEWSEQKRDELASSLGQVPDVDVVALRMNGRVRVRSKAQMTDVTYYSGMNCSKQSFGIGLTDPNSKLMPAKPVKAQCADALDAATNQLYYPYLLSNLAHYFRAEHAPDAVVIAAPGVGFNNHYHGQHGGPTARELYVPLLMHGVRLKPQASVPALWEVLDFL